MEELDVLDYKILSALQTNNMMPQREIGNNIGLSAPAVQRRIARLREIGAIKSDVSILNPTFLASPITIIVQVEMETDKLELINNAKKKFSSTPQVQQCYYVTGEVDFILIINVLTMMEYESLTHQLFFNNPAVQRFKSSICMDYVKVGLGLPVPVGGK